MQRSAPHHVLKISQYLTLRSLANPALTPIIFAAQKSFLGLDLHTCYNQQFQLMHSRPKMYPTTQ